MNVLPINFNQDEKFEVQKILRSWGLNECTISIINFFGVNSKEILEKIEVDDIDKLFDKLDGSGYFGERVKFKYGLRQWRTNMNKPMLCDQGGISPQSSRKVLQWLEKISNDLISYNSSRASNTTASNICGQCTANVPGSKSQDLVDLLKSTVKGQMILSYHDKNQRLDGKRQKHLTHCIINNYIGKGIKMSYNDMNNWANAIAEIFICEKAETYFMARKPGKKNPTGKLFSRWGNVEHIDSSQKTEEPIQDTQQEDSEVAEICDDDYLEKKLWLSYNCSPIETVRKYWAETSKIRTDTFKAAECNLTTLLQAWPRFHDANGYELIDIDFEILYPGKGNLLFTKYESFQSKIIQCFEEDINDTASKEMQKLLVRDDITKDSKDYIVTLLLHSVLQPIRLDKSSKPSIIDAQEDFVLHVRTANDLEPKLEALWEDFTERGETLQPRIVVVGPDIHSLTDFYVYWDRVKYKSCTYIKCVDTIIKLSNVYNIEYSRRSKLVWTFFEQYFFELESEKFSSISNMLSKLN